MSTPSNENRFGGAIEDTEGQDAPKGTDDATKTDLLGAVAAYIQVLRE